MSFMVTVLSILHRLSRHNWVIGACFVEDCKKIIDGLLPSSRNAAMKIPSMKMPSMKNLLGHIQSIGKACMKRVICPQRPRSDSWQATPGPKHPNNLEPRHLEGAAVLQRPAHRRHLRIRAELLPVLPAEAAGMVQSTGPRGLLAGPGRQRSGHPRRRVQGRADGAHADRALPKREDVAQPAESGPRAGVRRGWGRPAPGRRHLRFQHRERARLGLPSDPGQCASGVLQQGAAVGPFPGLLLPDHAHPGLQRARGRHQP